MPLKSLILGDFDKRFEEMDQTMVNSINLEANEDFYKRTLPGSIVIFLLLVISGFISDLFTDTRPFYYILTAFSLVSALIHLLMMESVHAQEPEKIKRWEMYIAIIAISTAIYWAAFCGWVLLQNGITDISLVYLLFSIGIGSGAAASIFIWKQLAQLYLVIVLLVPVVILLTIDNIVAIGLGFSFIVYFLFLFFQVHRSNNEYWTALINSRLLEIQAKNLEEAHEVKSRFLTAMSHELRTPLNAIMGFSQLLNMDAKNDVIRKQTNEVLNAGRYLLQLVNEILDLSKIESGEMSLKTRECNVIRLIEDCVAIIAPAATKNSITIKNNIDLAENVNINADETRFKQVILNLLSNAIKYNKQNGIVILESKFLDNERLQISVTDEGPGLTPEQIENIFKPFERLGVDCMYLEEAGLGLAISKDLVERMKGTIGVDSVEGIGSRFWVSMPMNKSSFVKASPD